MAPGTSSTIGTAGQQSWCHPTRAAVRATESADPAISGDGQIVAFESTATDLVEGDTNDGMDVFVHDRGSGTTTRVSVHTTAPRGTAQPRPIHLAMVVSSVRLRGKQPRPKDTNKRRYLHPRPGLRQDPSREHHLQREAGQGRSENPVVSADGRFVAFDSRARNLVRATPMPAGCSSARPQDGHYNACQRQQLWAAGNSGSLDPTISDNGRYIAFRAQRDEPGAQGHERQVGRLPTGPHQEDDQARQPHRQRRSNQERRQRRPCHLRRRTIRRLRVDCSEHRERHDPDRGRLPAGPASVTYRN